MYLYEYRRFMKITLQDTQQRIFEIMSQMDSSLLLTELNQKYLDILLDKISKGGMESLKPGEKQTLIRMSNDEDVPTPEKNELDDFPNNNKLRNEGKMPLRFTVNNYEGDPLSNIPDKGELINDGKQKYNSSYIHGKAEQLAGGDIPKFIDGDLLELDKPIDQQYILMVLPSGEYECIATPTLDYIEGLDTDESDQMAYYLTLKEEHNDDII